ncbi:GAF domain-containing protein [Paenibacillus qinlingensis]|uniref:GAF domain-containing protein n=1 Tax=Paenibacillus qinlingensis TaxID=1837343 RepID=UPI00156360CD|nr:GAF domain-containing protein [Paenibacillus qinlingensis]NQX62977.1 GAF domain-containing protein [Paenibacillus qinlingensis]
MAIDDATLLRELERLRSLTSCDFVAIAPLHEHAARIRWQYVIGNSNHRYQQMVIKKGQGLAGSALRLGRCVKLDDTYPQHHQERLHCPLMLAEQLQAAAVFPLVPNASSQIKGLLFIGKREQTRFEHGELLAVQENIDTLVSYLSEVEAAVE